MDKILRQRGVPHGACLWFSSKSGHSHFPLPRISTFHARRGCILKFNMVVSQSISIKESRYSDTSFDQAIVLAFSSSSNPDGHRMGDAKWGRLCWMTKHNPTLCCVPHASYCNHELIATATMMHMQVARLIPRSGYRASLCRGLQTAAAPAARVSDFAFAFE